MKLTLLTDNEWLKILYPFQLWIARWKMISKMWIKTTFLRSYIDNFVVCIVSKFMACRLSLILYTSINSLRKLIMTIRYPIIAQSIALVSFVSSFLCAFIEVSNKSRTKRGGIVCQEHRHCSCSYTYKYVYILINALLWVKSIDSVFFYENTPLEETENDLELQYSPVSMFWKVKVVDKEYSWKRSHTHKQMMDAVKDNTMDLRLFCLVTRFRWIVSIFCIHSCRFFAVHTTITGWNRTTIGVYSRRI